MAEEYNRTIILSNKDGNISTEELEAAGASKWRSIFPSLKTCNIPIDRKKTTLIGLFGAFSPNEALIFFRAASNNLMGSRVDYYIDENTVCQQSLWRIIVSKNQLKKLQDSLINV
jgi:hypothetical protein